MLSGCSCCTTSATNSLARCLGARFPNPSPRRNAVTLIAASRAEASCPVVFGDIALSGDGKGQPGAVLPSWHTSEGMTPPVEWHTVPSQLLLFGPRRGNLVGPLVVSDTDLTAPYGFQPRRLDEPQGRHKSVAVRSVNESRTNC
jgi:hypothetical protein